MTEARHERLVAVPDPPVLVDGHVHFHECFTWKAFLESAAANFADIRRTRCLTSDSPGCLLFTESAGVNRYRALLDTPALARTLDWHVETGDDGCSIILTRRSSETIVFVPGRQIVTKENLEVLALGANHELRDGRPIRDTLAAVVDCGAVAVVPWGFGKWVGRRRQIVRDLIDNGHDVPFCLGDNGGRASLMRRPDLFDRAERRAVPVLGGSDPLPVPNHAGRVGSYGFILDAWRPTSRPMQEILARIRALRSSPSNFGELSPMPAAVFSQLALQWRRYRVRAKSRKPAVA